MASQLAVLAAMYSASAELSAMKFFFLPNQDIIVDPNLKQHLEVLFLTAALLSQLESVYSCNFTSPSPRYLRPYSTVPLKYLSTCFATTQCSCHGYTMNSLKVFTAKHISALVLTKYIKEAINCLYNMGSTNSEFEVVPFFRLVIMGVAIGLLSFIRNLFRI
jgi:hypothetical protein